MLKVSPTDRLSCCDPLSQHPRRERKRNLRKISETQLQQCKDLGLHEQSRLCTQCRKILATVDFATLQAAARTSSSPTGDSKETDGDDENIPGPSGLNIEQLELDHELSTVNESLVLLGESPLKRKKFCQQSYVSKKVATAAKSMRKKVEKKAA